MALIVLEKIHAHSNHCHPGYSFGNKKYTLDNTADFEDGIHYVIIHRSEMYASLLENRRPWRMRCIMVDKSHNAMGVSVALFLQNP